LALLQQGVEELQQPSQKEISGNAFYSSKWKPFFLSEKNLNEKPYSQNTIARRERWKGREKLQGGVSSMENLNGRKKRGKCQ
jgi:hypothetical protein